MSEWKSKLAILILNYNCANQTLANIYQLKKLSDELIIVIVDNCSTDDSVKQLKQCLMNQNNIIILENKRNEGYAAGNNFGLRHIRKNITTVDAVLISNPDIIISNIRILEKMYKTLHDIQDIGAITVQTIYNGIIHEPNESCWRFASVPRMLMMSSILFGRFVDHKRYKEYALDESGTSKVDIVQGCFFMSRIEVLESIGYFDSHTFLYSEEMILATRLHNAGYSNVIIPTEYIYHNHKEKDRSLINYRNKIFDMRCYFDSRKYFVVAYTKISKPVKKLVCCLFEVNFTIKKLLLKIRLDK